MNRRLRSLVLVAASLGVAHFETKAATFNLETAGIPEIQAAVDAGALTYEKLVSLYLARIAAYDQQGPILNTVITLNPKALETARALDAEYKAKGRRSPLHGIPVLSKDNYNTADMPTTGGSFLLEGSYPPADAPMIKQLRDAGAIILAKVNMDEFAAGGSGFSSLGGQTRNPHDPKRVPLGSSGGTGAGLAAWFAPIGLGTDTSSSVRGPAAANGIVGLKPTTGLLTRSGIIPRVLTFDTGGPMARNVYDLALELGFLTGVDPTDSITSTSAGLFYKDYTPFLKKDALKGVRLGIIRDGQGVEKDRDAVFDNAVAELKAQGAVVVDPLNYPAYILQAQASMFEVIRRSDIREGIVPYLATLKPGYPKTFSEMISRAEAFTQPKGKITPYPALYARFKLQDAGQPSSSLRYRAVKEHGLAMVRDAVLGLIEEHKLDALVYLTQPTRPALINPDEAKGSARGGGGTGPSSLLMLASMGYFPDVVVPAGATSDKLPVTISILGPAFSEPRILAYAYAYEQATHHRVSPSTTPALPGEKFDY